MGIKPGDKIELDLLPDAKGILKAAHPAASIGGFVGLLAGRTTKVATLEEIGGETSVSFDKKAVALLEVQGQSARLL